MIQLLTFTLAIHCFFQLILYCHVFLFYLNFFIVLFLLPFNCLFYIICLFYLAFPIYQSILPQLMIQCPYFYICQILSNYYSNPYFLYFPVPDFLKPKVTFLVPFSISHFPLFILHIS